MIWLSHTIGSRATLERLLVNDSLCEAATSLDLFIVDLSSIDRSESLNRGRSSIVTDRT